MSRLLDSCPQNPRDAAIYLDGAGKALDFALRHSELDCRHEYDMLTRIWLRLRQRVIQQHEGTNV